MENIPAETRFSLETAFLEISRIYKAEGSEQASDALFSILKGADDSTSKKELFERFYTLSNQISLHNPDFLSELISKSQVIKKIYNYSGVMLDERIEHVSEITNENVYITHFLCSELLELDANSGYGERTDELLLSGSVVSVLLRVIYGNHLASQESLKKIIKRKEAFASGDLSGLLADKQKKVKESFIESLRKVKTSILNSEYIESLDKIKMILKNNTELETLKISELISEIKTLKETLLLSGPKLKSSFSIDDEDFIDTEVESLTIEPAKTTLHKEVLGLDSLKNEVEKMKTSIDGMSGSIKENISQILAEFLLSREAIGSEEQVDSKQNQKIDDISKKIDELGQLITLSHIASDDEDDEEYTDSKQNQKIDDISKKIDELGQLITLSHIASDDEDDEGSNKNTSEDTNIPNLIKDTQVGILSAITSEFDDIKEAIKAISQQSPEATKQDSPNDSINVEISILRGEVNSLSESLESVSAEVGNITSILQSIAQDISSEIEIARKFRDGLSDA